VNIQKIIRLGDAHLPEKNLGHIGIKMLAGVEDHFRDWFLVFSFWFLVESKDGPTDHGRLDELGASADYC
jgi:hypothetical protein